jgi:hypothetical protein
VGLTGGVADLDDYSATRVEQRNDLGELFVARFFLGGEADDRLNALAFDRRLNPAGAPGRCWRRRPAR